MTASDKLGVFLWRRLIVPLVEILGGKKYPKGRVQEFAYGNSPFEKLDYLLPGNVKDTSTAIVHIHGGGWVAGSKGRFYAKPLLRFSDDGYPVFSLNYPLAPEHKHPQLICSVMDALVWIKRNFPIYDSVHLIGDSAGGNLAMMVGIILTNPELLNKSGGFDIADFPAIKSVVDIYGVNDRSSWIEDGFSSAKLFSKMYFENSSTTDIPIFPMDVNSFVGLPPTFIVGAEKDKLLRSSEIWAERIAKEFNNVQYKVYKGASHGLFCFGKGSKELWDDMITFFRKND